MFSAEECNQIKTYLTKDLINDVFSFNQKDDDLHRYDQPFAYISFKGFLDYVNVYTERQYDTTHIEVADGKQLFHLFFNCKADSIKDTLSKDIRTDQIEVGAYQNLFDNFLIPPEIELDLEQIMEHPNIKRLEKVTEMMDKFKIKPKGQLKAAKDPVLLGKLNPNKLQSPKISNETNFRKAKRAPHPDLDKISLNQNIMWVLEDKESGADLAVMTMELNTHFFARSRPGMLMKYGRTQEIKAEYGKTDARIKDCQFISKEDQMNFDPDKYKGASGGASDDDDDDFEDDDEEDGDNQGSDKNQDKKLKPSNLA